MLKLSSNSYTANPQTGNIYLIDELHHESE